MISNFFAKKIEIFFFRGADNYLDDVEDGIFESQK